MERVSASMLRREGYIQLEWNNCMYLWNKISVSSLGSWDLQVPSISKSLPSPNSFHQGIMEKQEVLQHFPCPFQRNESISPGIYLLGQTERHRSFPCARCKWIGIGIQEIGKELTLTLPFPQKNPKTIKATQKIWDKLEAAAAVSTTVRSCPVPPSLPCLIPIVQLLCDDLRG